jgi:hypothetical protein
MRCPDCSKFVSMETEVEEPTVDLNGTSVSCEVHIARNCADCGTELKSADLSLECDLLEVCEDLKDCFNEDGTDKDGHDLTLKEDGMEPLEEGGGRYAKSYFGATVSFTVTCSCGKEQSADMTDKVAASEMEECV